MVAAKHRILYDHLRQRITELGQRINLADDSVGIGQEVSALQSFFRTEIVALPIEAVDSTAAQTIQSYQVEISKQLRLLGVDASFWQAARQAQTRATRGQHLQERLGVLLQYCDRLLEMVPDETPHQG